MGVKNIIITGIGGQGVLYLSSLLRRALVEKYGAVTGYDVRGGAQRLGHVASIIRFEDSGDAARRLAIDFDDGACDFALALEASELLKFNAKLSSRSLAISDEFIINPTNIRRRDGTYYGFEAIKRH
ncbi:MAG TPA: 2-oxoacid:acceptor oxidoreductase family protein, partial [Candidatus Wallbacteria bacterium]|nr:2-oxoacid:acceptor oxidoreductase family protein [Candidatus Wallbacteria bacterium]